jgi:diguanylate cyclase (GGDEF)-like protein/PAS domain S-box-containing protein
MHPLPADMPSTARSRAGSAWTRFVQQHLYDYNPAAIRLWLALTASGLFAAVWALIQLSTLAWPALAQVQLGIAFVVAAALFPVQIPRTKYSVGVADVFVFALLALHGTPTAALAAGAEGLVGAWRSSRRMTSRVSTPAVATAAMLLCGVLFDGLQQALVAIGLTSTLARLAALCIVALLYFAGTTLPLLAVVAAKNGQRLKLRDWAQSYTWVAAIYLISALVAGILAINVQQFGAAVIAVAATVVFSVVFLLNYSLRRNEAERQAQNERIAVAQREATLNQQRFTAAFTHAAIGMAVVQLDGRINQTNQSLCDLLGCDEAAMLGSRFNDLLHPDEAELLHRRVEGLALGGGEAFSMELRCRAQAGEIWVSLHCGRFVDPVNDRDALIYQLHDITSRRRAEGQLHYIAYHDSITDLANRNCFSERLGIAVERGRADATQGFAVIFLDLDRFKVVNDSLGHIAGNLVLREVALRLTKQVGAQNLVARLGGDEFAVLVEQVHDRNDALGLAQRLLDALSAPIMINGTEVVPCASGGITFSDMGYRTVDEVLRDADLAMYEAKAGGRQRVTVFEAAMHERVAEKLKLEGDLRRAIGEGQLSLVYQPLFELEPYRLSGFEALARWVHPERGYISPAVFIELAEESGNVEALTAWVIAQAARQLAQWHAAHPHMAHVGMHVNISGRDLAGAALVDHVRDVLAEYRLAARHLTLEITESTLMRKLSAAQVNLLALRELGVKCSIDDFGTGYSSLAYLSTLPIDSLKIDRTFVMSMDQKPQNVEIVRAVLTLGRSLGKKVIAEGIETADQLATLKDLGVPIGQGYLLSRPLRAEQIAELLRNEQCQIA